MDDKTYQYMKERVEKASTIMKAIDYRKATLRRLNESEATGVTVFMTGQSAEIRRSNSTIYLGFGEKIKAEAIRILEEEIAKLQKQLDEL